jgi:chorismate synthase
MTRLRWLTAGESHGPALTGILDGLPAGLPLLAEHLVRDLQRRKAGYGRGGRMKIEPEEPRILSGVRHGFTLGTPLAVLIENADHLKAWASRMAIAPLPEGSDPAAHGKDVTLPRPGHADAVGSIKFGHRDLRNSLERASARETAMRVALGAVARRLLEELDVTVGSFVASIGHAHARDVLELDPALRELAQEDAGALALRADASPIRCLDPEADAKLCAVVDEARGRRDTVGGTFEIRATGLVPGLGSYTQRDLKLDGLLAQAVACIHAIKAVEIGDGWRGGELFGSQVHDAIDRAGAALARPTNRAGGLEGGVTNGEPLVVRAAMKPIATVPAALRSVDLRTGAPDSAHVERSDTCAVPAAAVVGEAMVALALAEAILVKLGGDSLAELHAAHRLAWRRARLLEGHVFLCGLPGAGKSTVAPLLAAQLGLSHADVDEEIVRGEGRSVAEIFAREGEGAFRAREAAAVRALAQGPRRVIALGGGALGSRAVRLWVRRTGNLVWLSAPLDICVQRAAQGGAARPLLEGDAAARIAELARAREPLYARLADARIEARLSAAQVAELAASAVRSLEAERAHAVQPGDER